MAEPDYRKLLEELAEWRDAEVRAFEEDREGCDEFDRGYADAMVGVRKRIREAL